MSDENDSIHPGVSKIVERVESTNPFMHACTNQTAKQGSKRSIMTRQQRL
jgi:hypothetical protein